MTTASGSNLRLAYIKETVWGTTPGSPQTKILSGITGESLGGSQDELKSAALNPNRGIEYVAAGQKKAQGDLNYELGVRGAVNLLAFQMGNIVTTGAGPYTHVLTVAQEPTPFTLEKWFGDLATGFKFSGCKANTFSISIDPNGISTGSIGVIAKKVEAIATEVDSTPTAVSHAFYDGIRAQVKVGGVVVTDLVKLDINMTNNLQTANAIGSDELASCVQGIFECSGTITVPFTDMTLINKVINGTEDSLEVTFTNGSYSVKFLMPRIKYSGDPVPKGNGPTAINLDLSFSALLDVTALSPTLGKSIVVTVISDEATL